MYNPYTMQDNLYEVMYYLGMICIIYSVMKLPETVVLLTIVHTIQSSIPSAMCRKNICDHAYLQSWYWLDRQVRQVRSYKKFFGHISDTSKKTGGSFL